MNSTFNFHAPKLADKAVLVKLTIRRAALTRRDDQITHEIQQTYGDQSLMALTKLFRNPKSPINHIMRAVNEVYIYHRTNTLPYVDAGPRILPNQNYMDYTNNMRSLIAKVDAMLNQWMPHYDQLVQDDIIFRNAGLPTGRASVNDYPTAEQFKARTSFDLRFQPMPDRKHFLFDLTDDDEQAFASAMEDAARLARNDTVMRMLEPLQHLVKRLEEYKGEAGQRFHKSAIENVIEGCRMARRLAIDPPTEFMTTVDELERLCTGYVFGLDAIKSSDSTREAARDKLKAIASAMAAFA